ncbi:MAG: hypothetical protein ACE5HU_06710 [Acidobacteriota bacterium]
MTGRVAGLLFLSICLLLAILLMLGRISSVASGSAFAAALVVLGGLSRGFRR